MLEQDKNDLENNEDKKIPLKGRVLNELMMIAISLVVGLLVASPFAVRAYSEQVSGALAEQFIRFHVLANSDTQADQALKLKVRDGVLAMLAPELEHCERIEDTRAYLKASFAQIKQTAEGIIQDEGYDYDVQVSLENVAFPTRQYGDITLVAGEYEALRIEIGKARGQNWWCVVYPPLCYVDVTHGAVAPEYKEQLRENLTPEQYQLVVETEEPTVQFKFKLVEVWQETKLAKAKKPNQIALNSQSGIQSR